MELALAGTNPVILDRSETVGDPLCGGFMSWRTLAQLELLGVNTDGLGGHTVDHLRLFAQGRTVETPLPHPALGLSRHALDSRLRRRAVAAGARLEIDTIRKVSPGTAHGQSTDWMAESIFLASGKHDIRGTSRPRLANDPALGLRIKLPRSEERTALIGSAIELHLFRGGYVGIVLQEGETANICLALRKSALGDAGGEPLAVLQQIADQNDDFAARLGSDWRQARIETIGAVPYGWIAHDTSPGLFRLGDQAAVIPSLAGEGMSIAVASGTMAARHWCAGGSSSAPAFQRAFAARAYPPVQLAKAARILAETRLGSATALALARLAPSLVIDIAERCRIMPTSGNTDRATCAHARPC